jgi:hypothetical protein
VTQLTTQGRHEPLGVEERLRARLEELAAASGIPVPPLVVVPPSDDQELLVPARVGRGMRPARIEVTVPLVVASPAEQDWYLASCLAWWISPVPRRRRRVALALAVPLGVLFLVVTAPWWELPEWLAHASRVALGAIATLVGIWSHRWPRRAMDEVGLDVLAAAGRDPAVVAREVFGQAPPPTLRNRLFSSEPVAEDRIAAAEARRQRPAPPLH